MNKSGLSDQIILALKQLFSQAGSIEQVLLYGSRAKGSFKPYSDIDLAVFGKDLTSREFTALWSGIEDLPIIFKLDLLHWDTLENTELKSRILRDGKLFYSPQTDNKAA